MNSAQYLQFLRPYAYQGLPAKKQPYLRIYDGARQHGVASRAARRCLVTAAKGRPVELGVEAEKDATATRSHAVAARIEELSQAKALVYPRIQKSTAVPMRIPTFREKYRDVSKDKPSQEEVVLHGTSNDPVTMS
jgi:lysyl-tRNA synthetase class 2